jgi:purine-binding chemotaxis protein CheW
MSTENSSTSEIEVRPAENGGPGAEAQLQDLLPFTIGDRTFAVFVDQVDGTAEHKPFAALPRAPHAVIGVVCVRGRMLTVLDPTVVLDPHVPAWESSLPYVIVLRGEEQLAVAAETCQDTITISSVDIEDSPEGADTDADIAVGLVRYAGQEMLILDSSRLFSRAVQRRERRRRRF